MLLLHNINNNLSMKTFLLFIVITLCCCCSLARIAQSMTSSLETTTTTTNKSRQQLTQQLDHYDYLTNVQHQQQLLQFDSTNQNSIRRIFKQKQTRTIYFGGFFPHTGNHQLEGGALGLSMWPAVRLALDHINNNSTILRNYKLEIVPRDTQVSSIIYCYYLFHLIGHLISSLISFRLLIWCDII